MRFGVVENLLFFELCGRKGMIIFLEIYQRWCTLLSAVELKVASWETIRKELVGFEADSIIPNWEASMT